MKSCVQVEVTPPLATAFLTRPPTGAAIDARGWSDIERAFRALSDRDDVRCVVVRGMIPALAWPARSNAGPRDPAMERALAAIRTCKQPTVAVIEGLCTGAALEIAACCDLRVCGESSRFGEPLALPPRSPAAPEHLTPLLQAAPLARLLGGGALLDALARGEVIDAAGALASGLVQRVAPDGRVVERAYALAARVAAGAPLVNPWHKRLVRRLEGLGS
ncbi:MAG TPA: enoyl-CoA hydratase/isomerase family protein [Longimicrobiales bacterium]|nr:enoyl-CoA hydratase/isomerase family protein [Longimicrobiales bacterium]